MAEGMISPDRVALDPFAPGFYADPYPQYAALREQDPLHRTPFGGWLVTRWDDVHRLLRDPTTSVEDRNLAPELVEFDGDRYGCAAGFAPCSIAVDRPWAALPEPAELRPPLFTFAFAVPCVLLPLLAASALLVPPTDGVSDDRPPPFPWWPC